MAIPQFFGSMLDAFDHLLRDALFKPTPASAATSRIVARLTMEIVTPFPTIQRDNDVWEGSSEQRSSAEHHSFMRIISHVREKRQRCQNVKNCSVPLLTFRELPGIIVTMTTLSKNYRSATTYF